MASSCGTQGEEILHRGDAVAQHLGGADQRAQPHLLERARGRSCRVGMQRPDVEGHFLEQALRHHVMRMVVRVDEARHDELAGGIDDLDAPSAGRFGPMRSIRSPAIRMSARAG